MNQKKSFFEGGNPKVMFTFGFVSGIAAISLIFSGTMISSAAGLKIGTTADTGTVAVANTQGAAAAPSAQATAPASPIPAVTSADHIRGNKNAKVVIVEYGDIQCPYCGAFHPTMLQVMKDYGDKVEWVFRHFPLSFHPNAQPAAVASECASEQGKFWEFLDAMYADQNSLATDFYVKTATSLGLNVTQFKSCLTSGKYDKLIANDESAGEAAGVNGTPTTFINGKMLASGGQSIGAAPYSTIKSFIDQAIAAAK